MSAIVPISFQNTLPASLVVLSAELVEQRDSLAIRANMAAITDTESLARAESVFIAIDKFSKQVSESRLAITRQIDALKAQMIAAERSATGLLDPLRDRLAKMVADYRTEVARVARIEAERIKAEAEKQAAEMRAKQEEAARAERERMAAVQKIRDDEAALFGEACTPEPVAAVVVPVHIPIVERPAPAIPELPKSAVRTQTRFSLELFDAEKIIAAACVGGGKIHGRAVLTIDEKAVEALLKAGCPVDGARLIAFTSYGSAGRK